MSAKKTSLEITPISERVIPKKYIDEVKFWLSSLGFDYYVYCVFPTDSFDYCHALNGFSEQWTNIYIESELYKKDPIIIQSREGLSPIIWNHDDNDDIYSTIARNCGIKHTYAIASPFTKRNASLLAISSKNNIKFNNKEHLQLFGGMSIHLKQLNQMMLFNNHYFCQNQEKAALTHRELDCLKWISQGKTAWEASKILGISERTVVFHLNNCSKKLLSSNRIQMVHQATKLGLI